MRPKLVIALTSLLLLTACGTRLPDEAFVEAGTAAGGTGAAAAGGTGTASGPRTGGATTGGATATTAAGGGTGGQAAPGATVPGGAPADPNAGGAPAGPNQASDVGVTETTIKIGSIVAENGVLGDAFAPAARGLRAWVEHINANGGIAGRQIELFTCDDREDRARTLECARRLVEEDQVFALLAVNSRAIGGAAEYLQEQGIPVLGMPITASFWRFSHFWSIYPEGYARDNQTVGHNGNLINQTGFYRWFRENMGVSRAAVFAYDVAESAQAADFIVTGLELEGFTVTRYNVSFAAPSFDQAVADMQRNGVDFIVDSMDDGANRRLCDAMARRSFSVPAKLSTVVAFGDSIGTDFNETCRNSYFISGHSRAYSDTSVPAIAEFNEAMERYQPGVELHQWALEAWVQGIMLRDYLVAAGPAPTRAGFEEFLMNLDDFTGDGIMKGDSVDYRPRDYDSPTRRHCFALSRWQDSAGGWVEATGQFPFCYDDAKQYPTPVREQGT
jgi:branched-chain amino acid transport system substrate-binding protein